MDREDNGNTVQPNSPMAPGPAPDFRRIGVHCLAEGLSVAIVAPNAQALEFCIFSSAAAQSEETRYQLHGPVEGIWHGFFPDLPAGTIYGLRAYGSWNPDRGHYYNPQKLLLDPYARALVGELKHGASIHAYAMNDDMIPVQPWQPSALDSAADTVKAAALPRLDPPLPGPNISWEETVIYEAHVVGLTKKLTQIPEELRGTYAGLGHPETVKYLKDLGITAIELLPVHAKADEPFLLDRGLTNYWGYSTLNYFSPEPSYATASARAEGPQAVVQEFRNMVSSLHEAGLEVILDVVYNHTCEGDSGGPALSWRGLDNYMYYRLNHSHFSTCLDYTGCGNTLDTADPRVIQMILDSLRYWSEELGVDGFRFDLGVTLARMRPNFSPDHPFIAACLNDPILRSKKMIMEPWDLGPDGWKTADFPLPFSAWNDRYRDCLRGFWLSDARAQARGESRGNGTFELATRLSGSQDMFGYGTVPAPRSPRCSVNFITAHDGFTMADLTSYDHKHNEANREENRDGSNNNLSWNHGMEGSSQSESRILGEDFVNSQMENGANSQTQGSDDCEKPDTFAAEESVLADLRIMRLRSCRNLFASLLLSSGTPMILAGDEIGRTQFGNNNSYCQNSPISWVNWELSNWQKELQQTVKYLLALRKEHPIMRPADFSTGQVVTEGGLPDLSWYDRAGQKMEPQSWHDPYSRVVQMLRCGKNVADTNMLVVFNGVLHPQKVVLPAIPTGHYRLVWDSSWNLPELEEQGEYPPGEEVELEALSLKIFFTN